MIGLGHLTLFWTLWSSCYLENSPSTLSFIVIGSLTICIESLPPSFTLGSCGSITFGGHKMTCLSLDYEQCI
jgi:hypothetical protein